MTGARPTRDEVLAVIRDPAHFGRSLWTPSVVLDRMGRRRRFEPHTTYDKRDRLAVRDILRALHAEGLLVVAKERHTLHSATWTGETAYRLPAPGEDGGPDPGPDEG